MISMGADAHYMDPLAGLSLSSPGYVELIKRLHTTAKKMNAGLALTLEGGYHTSALAEVVAGIATYLSGKEVPEYRYDEIRDKDALAEKEISRASGIQNRFWNTD
jgi:acetoin utilization deacetylase AcuC-like enzyme